MKKMLLVILCSLLLLSNAGAKSAVIYFSRADENYSVGTVKKGNTQVLAEIIAEETASDLFRIERALPYPKDYAACTEEAQAELKKQARPALKATLTQKELDAYDVIYFGSPVWWGNLPMAVYAFAESLDWSGKKVFFFGTHEGSGAEGIAARFQSAAKGCLLGDSILSMYGHDAQKNDARERKAVKDWLKKQ